MSFQTRRELAVRIAFEYRKATKKVKSRLLKEFCELTNYHPKYAVVILKEAFLEPKSVRTRKKPEQRKRRRKYNERVRAALITLWRLSGYQCSKLLVEFIKENLEQLRNQGSLDVDEETAENLREISPATADRLLNEARFRRKRRRRDLTSSSPLLKSMVPLAKLYHRPPEPGHLQIDLVIHSGGNPCGEYVCTLSATDIFTGWSAAWACLGKSQRAVFEALEKVFSYFPFPIKSFQTDNGSEFLNGHLIRWSDATGIDFIRSEEYEKKENCYVEERNGHSIRKFVGYKRFETLRERDMLNRAYEALNLLSGLFWPRMRCIKKVREGSKVRRYFDKPATPLKRAIPSLSEDKAKELLDLKASLNIEELIEALETNLNKLYRLKGAPIKKETLSCVK